MPTLPSPGPSENAPSPETVGARLRRMRLTQGLSVRDVADRAGVDKNTILRLEKGLPTSGRTLDRVCEALGVYVSRILLPEPEEGETVVIHRRATEAWWPYPGMGEPFPAEGDEEGEGKGLAPPAPNNGGAGGDGESTRGVSPSGSPIIGGGGALLSHSAEGFVSSLACRMPRGRLRSSLLRLWKETTPNAHPGEEFVFCLSGRACLTVAGRTYTLEEGDAATFWCAERHTYAPEPGTAADQLPVLLLAVWLDAREERK